MKNEVIVHLSPLGIFSAFCFMFIIFLGDQLLNYLDIKLKFSAFQQIEMCEISNS